MDFPVRLDEGACKLLWLMHIYIYIYKILGYNCLTFYGYDLGLILYDSRVLGPFFFFFFAPQIFFPLICTNFSEVYYISRLEKLFYLSNFSNLPIPWEGLELYISLIRWHFKYVSWAVTCFDLHSPSNPSLIESYIIWWVSYIEFYNSLEFWWTNIFSYRNW